jgi:polysaccharide biosynthesis transport protein
VLAAGAAILLMQRYIDDQLETKFEAVRRASQWLETRAAELRQQVQGAEDRIAEYRAQRGLVQGVQAGLENEQVSRLNNELVQARAELAQAEGRLEAARGRAGAAALAAVAPSVSSLRNQLDQMGAQLKAELTRVGPNHPDAISLQNQVADLQRAVGAEAGRMIAATEADVRASRAKVAALEAAAKSAQTNVDTSEQAQVPLNAMQREADAARTMLQAVLEREQQIVQQTAIETPDARIISRALPPQRPSSPKTMLIIGLASIAGLLFGATFVYVMEATNRTFRSGDDVRHKLGVPCFALIPAVGRRTLGRFSFDEYVAHKPMSPLAEQLRALRAGLWLGSLTPRVLAITAARPAEGKTALAMALGRSMAMGGEKICVVDCDIRERAFARLLRAEGEAGLTDVLLGFVPLERAVRTDRLTSMSYLPAGSRQANSFGLFMSDGMSEVIRQLRERFDTVLLDVPPVLAMADARVAARLADATLLCVRWNHTPAPVVAHSLELLEEAQAHVCGVALTRVDARVHQKSGYADADIYHPRYAGYYRE